MVLSGLVTGIEKRIFMCYGLILLTVALICCMRRSTPLLQEREDIGLGSEAVTIDWNNRSFYHFYFIPLNSGIYTVHTAYQATRDLEIVANEWWESPGQIRHSPVPLRATDNYQFFNIYVEGNEALCNITVRETEDTPHFTPAEIQLLLQYRPVLTASYYAIRTAIPFMILFFIGVLVYYIRRSRDREKCAMMILLLGVAAVICLPLLTNVVFEAEGTRASMQHIASGSMILMIPAAAAHRLGIPLFQCYLAYIGMINVLTVFISFSCFSRITGSRQAGLFGSVIYSTCPLLFHIVYGTAAISAFSAAPFLPPIVLICHKLLQEYSRTGRRGQPRRTVPGTFPGKHAASLRRTVLLQFLMVCVALFFLSHAVLISLDLEKNVNQRNELNAVDVKGTLTVQDE